MIHMRKSNSIWQHCSDSDVYVCSLMSQIINIIRNWPHVIDNRWRQDRKRRSCTVMILGQFVWDFKELHSTNFSVDGIKVVCCRFNRGQNSQMCNWQPGATFRKSRQPQNWGEMSPAGNWKRKEVVKVMQLEIRDRRACCAGRTLQNYTGRRVLEVRSRSAESISN